MVLSVVVTVPGPLERKLTITGVTPRPRDTEMQLGVGVRNDGNVIVRASGKMALRDQSGAQRASLPLTIESLLPGDTAEYLLAWPKDLPAGDYYAEASLDTADSVTKGGTSGAANVAPPAHAEFKPDRPLAVKPPVVEQLPPTTPGGPATIVVRRPNDGLLPSWWPYAAGLLVLIVNGVIALAVLRRRRPAASASAPPPKTSTAAPLVQPPPISQPAPTPMRATVPTPVGGTASLFVKGRGATIYLLQDGVKRPLAGWQAFVAHGGQPNLGNVRLLPDDVLNEIPTGSPISAPDDARAS
jgi:hypothetical protein